mmetsp:Transcript_16005/g.24957  ORF Transcript_16005/g.24957 Transcript_16005/m.24957 type:complete len:90 (-) Transcript_16005:3901-4170(-)
MWQAFVKDFVPILGDDDFSRHDILRCTPIDLLRQIENFPEEYWLNRHCQGSDQVEKLQPGGQLEKHMNEEKPLCPELGSSTNSQRIELL